MHRISGAQESQLMAGNLTIQGKGKADIVIMQGILQYFLKQVIALPLKFILKSYTKFQNQTINLAHIFL